MKQITNPNYRKFLDEGIITIIEPEHIQKAIKNIKHHKNEGKALLTTLYYTGCRPNEALQLTTNNIKKEKNYLLINIPPSKGGLPRTIHLPLKHDLIKQLHQYAQGRPPHMKLFPNYTNNYTRTTTTKKGHTKTHTETTDKIRYHLTQWFKNVIPNSITPYYLRHNRFSKLAIAGLDDRDLRLLKGSRTTESLQYYIHMSTKSSKKIAKKIQ